MGIVLRAQVGLVGLERHQSASRPGLYRRDTGSAHAGLWIGLSRMRRKLSRQVPRGGGDRKVISLPDPLTSKSTFLDP